MFAIDRALLIVAILLLAGIFASRFAARLGLPVLVLFILVGMLAGEEGPGGIGFDNYTLAHGIATVALCFILFDGGLRTPLSLLRLSWKPAGLLASVGVVLTSVITGLAAAWILGIPLLEGLLLGSIVGSTDAAAVFSILRSKGLQLDPRLSSTLEVESGSNDPMAIFLTIGCLELITARISGVADLSLLLIQQMGIGLAAGAAVGWLAVRLINGIRLDAPGLYPVLAGVCGLVAFGVAAAIGGSGFLAVYLAGIWIGNHRIVFQRGTLLFHDGLAWIGQIVMFVVLGLLSYPSEVLKMAGPGLLIAAVLIFVARPLAVFPLLLPFGFRINEIIFISWTGLKGAVPIILATYPLLFGLADGLLFFNVIFFVVLVSAVTQGWSLPLVAKWLGLQREPEIAPAMSLELTTLRQVDTEVVRHVLRPGAYAVGKRLNELLMPEGMLVAMITRGDRLISPRGSTGLMEGDHVSVVLRDEVRPFAGLLFEPSEPGHRVLPPYLECPVNDGATLGKLQACFGIDLGGEPGATLGQFLGEKHPGGLSKGDLIDCGDFLLRVREVEPGGAAVIGIRRTKASRA